MTHSIKGGRIVKSVTTTQTIIEYLAETGSTRLCTIADDLDLADSTVHKHLTTLRRGGYVVKNEGKYQLGLRFLDIGGRAQNQHSIFNIAQPTVDELADETGERAQFVREEDGRGYYLHIASGKQGVRAHSRLGKRLYLHSTASGKAILSQLPEERVDAIIDRWGLVGSTENTVGDREELDERLDAVRERGYAINDEEHVKGLRGIAAPVMRDDGEVLGSLSVGGPSHRISDERLHSELANQILGAANEIELRVRFDETE
ncbi:MAG: IclR family transcriptional regulator [Haloplanus sp.]